MKGGGEGGYCTHIFVVHHLHESEFSECPLCVCLILKWLHKLLDCHPLPSHRVHGRAGGRGDFKHSFHFTSTKQSINYISLEKGRPGYYAVTHCVEPILAALG